MGNSIPSDFNIFPFFISNMAHFSIPNCIPISSLNILIVWIREFRVLSLLGNNLRSSMNSRWFIASPFRNSYQVSAALSMCVRSVREIINSKGDTASPCKSLLFISLLLQISQHHKLVESSSTLSFFPKHLPHFLLCPSYLSSVSPRSVASCHKLSNNRSLSIPSLSSSSFVLCSEGAFYVCITGPQSLLTFFWIRSALLIISHLFLKNHRFHQQLPLLTVSTPRRDMGKNGSCLLHFSLIYLSA